MLILASENVVSFTADVNQFTSVLPDRGSYNKMFTERKWSILMNCLTTNKLSGFRCFQNSTVMVYICG